MIIAGKIVGIQNRKVTSVLVEGFPEYIALDCLTDGKVVAIRFIDLPT